MKALIISAASMVIIIASWGIFVNYADSNLHELTGMIEDDILVSVYSEDWEKAVTQIESLTEKWHKQKKVYTFFFNTSAVMETDYSIAKAKNYIKSNSVPLASGELSCIKEQLGFLHLNELITLDNIF
ncbi:DUF4363 family protein [Anoxybacterium hadale]|uniref:DUF4363 family protein n=1 Tax=Anoxybacterium hadale TaxID=3408580 RepID=A0ACD1AGM6_9FIRM|nr:DUF4363 family protein [Clostridiales bacterium]